MAARADRDESIAAIAREVADDAVRLARAEIELAKAEAIAGVKKLAVAIGLFAGAAVLALFMVIFALGSVPTVLAGHAFSGWVWWLLTAALFLILAAVLGWMGLRSLRRGIGRGKQLVGSVKEDVAWFKRLTKRNASGS
ncbi:MAG TPA: phage holin family protein [Candidatus Dormibacteraeota bacterium]|nr:phage holin family protein [Candidatus Dormibacteraeota bacterium]